MITTAEKLERLEVTPVVPLIQANEVGVAVETALALMKGGLTVLEVVMRTDLALLCLQEIAAGVPGAITGAGTVLSGDHARAAAHAGARFLVSPGLHDEVVSASAACGLPLYPGVATATEVQRAWNMGFRLVKFFPAEPAGGVPMIRVLASVFRDVRFMPTGGVSAANLGDYLAVPEVIASGDFDVITELAQAAVALAQRARG